MNDKFFLRFSAQMPQRFVMRRKSAISTCFKTKICRQIREKQVGSGGARYHGQLLRQAARPGARGGAQVAILTVQ
jgi:hypothetical protein